MYMAFIQRFEYVSLSSYLRGGLVQPRHNSHRVEWWLHPPHFMIWKLAWGSARRSSNLRSSTEGRWREASERGHLFRWR